MKRINYANQIALIMGLLASSNPFRRALTLDDLRVKRTTLFKGIKRVDPDRMAAAQAKRERKNAKRLAVRT